ncbi:hypothetical protein ABID69_003903, partial [Stenotrophomonas sp. PvP087]
MSMVFGGAGGTAPDDRAGNFDGYFGSGYPAACAAATPRPCKPSNPESR